MDRHSNKYRATKRLFNIIDDLSREKKFILYKQLVKDNVESELFKFIIDMSEDEKTQLLQQLTNTSYGDEPYQTINLDDQESFMRKNPRKICLIAVKVQIGDKRIKSYIIDISKKGAFIESQEAFAVGQKILLEFKLPNYPHPIKLNGHIARSGPKCIGVEFYNISPTQQEVISKFIESKP